MADIDLKRIHHLGMKAARHAADEMAADLGRKFGLAGRWEGNVLHFDRPGVTGKLALTEKDLHLTVTLGFLLKALRGSIERAVHEELDSLFASKGTAKVAAAKPPAKKPVSPKSGSGGRKKAG
ncbi:MAG: polyhydroxyalkanoic acid system family protein [Burkholderiales bacterium]|nr:polyhydroxyalkanoic acid system family protein [Burkholderiales bacterium]